MADDYLIGAWELESVKFVDVVMGQPMLTDFYGGLNKLITCDE